MVKKKRSPSRLLGYFLIYLSAIVVLLPFSHMILSCFKTNAEINRVDLLPSQLSLDNFRMVFADGTFFRSLLNSLVVTGSALVIAILVCSLASYSIVRQRGKFFQFMYYFFLSAMMIPAATTLVPVYTLMQGLGLTNTLGALVLLYAAGSIGTGILLYSGFIKGVPKELEEAASIDGCGYLRRFFLVVFPLLRPVTITFTVLSSVSVWNDFLYPLLFISTKEKQPLTLLVYSFKNERASDWGAIYALLVLAALVPILFYFVMQKHFESGMTAGAIKG